MVEFLAPPERGISVSESTPPSSSRKTADTSAREVLGEPHNGLADKQWLTSAKLFAELGRELAATDPEETLHRLTEVTVSRIPAAHAASVTTLRDGAFRTVAASHDRARKADAVQYELGSGPCVDAIVEDTIYNPGDLRHDRRWPEFGKQVSELCGYTAMLSFRLAVDELIAGLNIYAEQPHVFDGDAAELGWLLATHGGIALATSTNRQRARNLQRALESNRDIGVAVGILMSRHRITRDQAFTLLRIASQRLNRKVHDLSCDVIDTGALPGIPHS
jgi:ANTAR domain-containing protein/GAF domain-containing protein